MNDPVNELQESYRPCRQFIFHSVRLEGEQKGFHQGKTTEMIADGKVIMTGTLKQRQTIKTLTNQTKQTQK